jgi:hypothetical protein
VRFKVFTAVEILMMFLWVKSPRGLVGRSTRYGERAVCIFSPEDGQTLASTNQLTRRLNPPPQSIIIKHPEKRFKYTLYIFMKPILNVIYE